jgi:hypothetical protein
MLELRLLLCLPGSFLEELEQAQYFLHIQTVHTRMAANFHASPRLSPIFVVIVRLLCKLAFSNKSFSGICRRMSMARGGIYHTISICAIVVPLL